MLENGYKIPFVTLPGPYEEKNNASVLRNPVVVESIIEELANLGVIEFTSIKPHCVSPLGLVSKEVDGVVKHRLVFDASRWINLFTEPPGVKLVHLSRALLMTRKNDFQVVFDLKSAYYNVRIAEEHVPYLGASFEIKGRKQYFCFRHLPFGLNSAVHAITKLWKPLLAYIHSKGVRLSVYIDDGRILASSPIQAEEHRRLVYDVIDKAGWQLALDKSDGPMEAAKQKRYLGFLIDSDSMSVHCPEKKIAKVSGLLKNALEVNSLPVKSLSSLLGHIISLLPSHGASTRICTRSSYAVLEPHVESHGWNGSVSWSPAAWRELSFFLANIQFFNGSPIETDLTDLTVRLNYHQDGIVVSDASNVKAVVKWLQGPLQGSVSIFQLSASEIAASSGERELLAVHRFFCQESNHSVLRNTNVIWLTDSTNVVAFLSKGSPKASIQQKVFEIFRTTSSLRCVLSPLHLFREDERIRQVDFLSKSKDSDNWSVDFATFSRFNKDFNFDIDLFADQNNRKVAAFMSKFYHLESVAVDAFSASWLGMCWVCPPVSLISAVIRRIKTSSGQGLLIVPNWPTSDYYCDLFNDGVTCKPFVVWDEFRPYIFQNEGARNTPLFGNTSFTFFALYFNTL